MSTPLSTRPVDWFDANPVGPPYHVPWWLPGGHLQTLYPVLLRRGAPMDYRRERWELADGDFIDADWVDTAPAAAPVVVVFHGLEGGSQSVYARDLMRRARAHGWRGVVPHFRGCSGAPNRLPRAYFAGDSAEIETILTRIHTHFPTAPLYAVGVSLGGNALLKWLGERGTDAARLVEKAAAISAPLDMRAAGNALDCGVNRFLYTAYFLATLKMKALAKAQRYPGLLDADTIRAARTFRAFDTQVTAPLHGYRDAEDYWARTSSKQGLKNIAVPTLVLNAKNDPFLPAWALPKVNEVSSWVHLEQPEAGGHAAFPSGLGADGSAWLSARLMAFMTCGR